MSRWVDAMALMDNVRDFDVKLIGVRTFDVWLCTFVDNHLDAGTCELGN